MSAPETPTPGWPDPADGTAPDDAPAGFVLRYIIRCAEAWEPQARIIGNARAGDIARACRKALVRADDLAARVAAALDAVREDAPGVVAEIAGERRRQVEAEGWTPEHDDQHQWGEIARAAAAYALHAGWSQHPRGQAWHHCAPGMWPWDSQWWTPKDARRDLIRAAALIVAEIERLDRAAIRQRGEEKRDAR
jgi:hypothetical protein